jgi:flagellar basal body-associated protein FliL
MKWVSETGVKAGHRISSQTIFIVIVVVVVVAAAAAVLVFFGFWRRGFSV